MIGGGVAQNFLRALPVSRAQADGGQRGAPHAGEGGEGRDEHEDGEGDAKAGEGGTAHLRDVADVDTVHNVVQHVDELGRHRGQGQLDHQRADGGIRQCLLASVGLGQAVFLQSILRPRQLGEDASGF